MSYLCRILIDKNYIVMINRNMNEPITFEAQERANIMARTFMSNVFLWMFGALGLTAITAYLFASTPSFIQLLINSQSNGLSILGWIVMFAPLGFVFLISSRYRTMSKSTLVILFLLFSVLMGMSLSFTLLAYTTSSIMSTFIVTSGTFGVMAFLGWTTQTDLTKFGSILFMALVGIILAMLVNFFLQSSSLEYIISILGVLIFTGLTAYDVQKLKRIGMATGEYTGVTVEKLSIMGALTLYLDFINLFLFLLRFMGNRR